MKKTTIYIDPALLAAAKASSGIKRNSDAIRAGLEALIRGGAYEKARALLGTEKALRLTPRRREEPATKRSRKAA